ncbi:RHS repeat-associated core domain-containing protein [Streptomyces sp. NPDC002054]|uniref:RHS repeat-associated core domain-containing protein n=1 Tax=Streptomyces sp. NPDC002054 TaxID=3154663 RepID=UPI00331C3627
MLGEGVPDCGDLLDPGPVSGVLGAARLTGCGDLSTTSVDDTSYTYAPAGDITSISRVEGAARDTQCFTYDHLRRLTQAWTDTGTTTTQPGPSVPGIGGCTNTTPQPGKIGGPAPYRQSFTYDVIGNRTSLTDRDPAGDESKTTTTTNTFSAPGTARPHAVTSTTWKTGTNPATTGAFTYDATGNTLTRPDADGTPRTLTWTPEGKLASATSVSGTSTYLYDADGNRLLRKDPGKTTLYLGSTELTLTTSTNAVTGTRYYATPGGTTIVRTSDGKLAYVAADHHNTGTTAVDAATLQVQRRSTKPFGGDRSPKPAAWPGERGFVGGTEDNATGLVHVGAREYDPRTSTFLSVDPVLVPDNNQELNAYSYSVNNPVTYSDPTGLKLACGPAFDLACPGSMPNGRPFIPADNSSGDGGGSDGGSSPSSGYNPNSNYNCSLNNCGPKPPAPPTPLPQQPWSLPPVAPPPAPPQKCELERINLACRAPARAEAPSDKAPAWKRAAKWAKKHRGVISSVGATIGCFVPAVGWVACGAMQAAAFGVRAEQRAAEDGGWQKTWQANTHDAIFTGATFGTGSALRYAKFGNLSRWVEPARVPAFYQRSAYQGAHAYHPFYTVTTSVPSIVGIWREYPTD